MQKTKPELLLPVGNIDMALAAVHNGADAIYVGFPGFNARGRTVDFAVEELQNIIEICHLHGVKVNLALNILIFESELATVTTLLDQIIPLKPDAFIVQDLGIIRLIKQMAPDQVIHASTQMTITNHEAISLLDDLNIKRFVLGRENSLSEIKLIKEKTDKELEVFVHGALCVAYSGQCFTSESIGGRSANRGQCAQSCRFGYDLIVDGNLHKTAIQKQHLVSPQDLCGINEIPALIDLGVASFKVEGRLKTPDYVSAVGREYRQAIDSHLSGNPRTKEDTDKSIQKMATTYSRGFFSGWLNGVDHQKLVDGTYSSHRGYLIGEITNIKLDTMIVTLNTDLQLKAGDGLVWAYNKGRVAEAAGAQIFESKKIGPKKWELHFSNNKKLETSFIGAKVYLNHDNNLSQELKKSYTDKNLRKRIPVQIDLFAEVGKPLQATITDGKNTYKARSTALIQVAQKKEVTDSFFKEELSALGGTVYATEQVHVHRQDNTNLFFPHKELKELRRNLTDQLSILRSQNTVDQFTTSIQPANDVISWSNGQKPQIIAEQNAKPNTKPNTKLNILLRDKEQVNGFTQAWDDGVFSSYQQIFNSIILDFEFGRDYLTSIQQLKDKKIRCGIATTRILKPQEYGNLKALEKINPDFILVRNLGALQYFSKSSSYKDDLVGDFSLNVTNHLTAQYLLSKGLKSICVSYDLNHKQVSDLFNAVTMQQMEVVVHQYMPSFHMEHCVFAAFLSKGSSFKDCGKPCEKHQVELRDQFGHSHFIKPDHECRNTMYNATSYSAARFLPIWQALGLGLVRYEALNEHKDELIQKIKAYMDLLTEQRSHEEIISELNLLERFGLNEGALVHEKEYFSRKKENLRI